MRRSLLVLFILPLLTGLLPGRDAPSDDDLRKRPITADAGPVGKLLLLWALEGTAAGNVGDWYDNRDGDHSPLDVRPYPQLRRVQYSADDVKQRKHWALQPRVLPHVVFGNSSTSGTPTTHGSNPRTYYCGRGGLALLERHYRSNNLYVYPEHRDHDPGHNGPSEGFGDLYPTNSPYLIISQGSSGSDQPFVRAIPFTLAAFRPEVKKKLISKGLLMPTVQMIFRASNNHLRAPDEYLTGKAHPSAFEGTWVDALAMVKLAHEIRATNIPPLIKLKVLEETKQQRGLDYFEPDGVVEQLADTSSCIARVWRGKAATRRLVVSAADSFDVNDRKLTFRWVLLRGDPTRVQIKPRDKAGTEAEITVAYHERRPVAPGAALASGRVDIGVFAHNGAYYSAPAFVTFFSLDTEGRAYDEKGRVVEIGYGMGRTELRIADLAGLCAALARDDLPARVLRLSATQRADLGQVAAGLKHGQTSLADARRRHQEADAARNKAATALREAEAKFKQLYDNGGSRAALRDANDVVVKARDAAHKLETELAAAGRRLVEVEAASRLAQTRRPALGATPAAFLSAALERAVSTPLLWNEHREPLLARLLDPANRQREGRVNAARQRALQLGVFVNGPKKIIVLRPARPGAGKPQERLTPFEQATLGQLNAVLLAELVLPGLVTQTFHANFVDARLTTPKAWRDVYHHDGDTLTGWTRYHVGPTNVVSEFTAEGWLVLKKDGQGRPTQARTVYYVQQPLPAAAFANGNPLRQTSGEELITFAYEGGRRKIVRRQRAPEEF